jgi:hypothetical protein
VCARPCPPAAIALPSSPPRRIRSHLSLPHQTSSSDSSDWILSFSIAPPRTTMPSLSYVCCALLLRCLGLDGGDLMSSRIKISPMVNGNNAHSWDGPARMPDGSTDRHDPYNGDRAVPGLWVRLNGPVCSVCRAEASKTRAHIQSSSAMLHCEATS